MATKKSASGSKSKTRATTRKKTTAARKPTARKATAKKAAAKKPAAKKPGAKKPTAKPPAAKKAAAGKAAAGKASAAKKPAGKGAKRAPSAGKTGTAAKLLARRSERARTAAKAAKSQERKTTQGKAAARRTTTRKRTTSRKRSSTRVSTAQLVGDAMEDEDGDGDGGDGGDGAQAKGKGLRLRSQPVEVQEIDVRIGRARKSRLPEFSARSFGKSPKKATAKEIQALLLKHLGRCAVPPKAGAPENLVQMGIYCFFAVGGTSSKAAIDAMRRLIDNFPDWNEFRISDAYELVEILEDLPIEHLFDRCEQVLEFVNEVYNDRNFVELEYLREYPVEDRPAMLGRYQSLPPSYAHFLALAIQDFEGFLFHYSWARVVQRLGLVPRSGSPKKLVAAADKAFEGCDTVSLQVDLIDLGEEICTSKNPNCKGCYLVLNCKGRKI
ncbi:MAG: hypothetical protein R3F30_04260 [Planctomycetota bacterium]